MIKRGIFVIMFLLLATASFASFVKVGTMVGDVLDMSSEVKLTESEFFDDEPLIFDVSIINKGNQLLYCFLDVESDGKRFRSFLGLMKRGELIEDTFAVPNIFDPGKHKISYSVIATNLERNISSKIEQADISIKEENLGSYDSFNAETDTIVFKGQLNEILIYVENSGNQGFGETYIFSDNEQTSSQHIDSFGKGQSKTISLQYLTPEESEEDKLNLFLYDSEKDVLSNIVLEPEYSLKEEDVSLSYSVKGENIIVTMKNKESNIANTQLMVRHYDSALSLGLFGDERELQRLYPKEERSLSFEIKNASKIKMDILSSQGKKLDSEKIIFDYRDIYLVAGIILLISVLLFYKKFNR